MDAATIYGAPRPPQPTGNPGPATAKSGERSMRTASTKEDGDPVAVLIFVLAAAVALGWLSINVEVGA